jgi:toxin ParE1/3/4
MSKAIHRRFAARQDLVDIFRYYAREAGLRVAERFFAQVETTFTRLASMPGMGTPYDHDHPALAELRYFPVSRFRKYLVFYRRVADGIEIVRVLHGARDIPNILAGEFGIEGDDDEATDSEESDNASP